MNGETEHLQFDVVTGPEVISLELSQAAGAVGILRELHKLRHMKSITKTQPFNYRLFNKIRSYLH